MYLYLRFGIVKKIPTTHKKWPISSIDSMNQCLLTTHRKLHPWGTAKFQICISSISTPKGSKNNKLDHKKEPGPDQIPARIIKKAFSEIAPTPELIFKKSYETGELLNDWKTANVSVIYKKGDKKNPANYRPVSLTSK